MDSVKHREHRTGTDRWTHRLAWLLALLVFSLLWLGALVTTFDAGMAVPDWPTTYGHWFYPLQQWLYQVNDLFLEHGHRTLAQLVGLVTIGLVWLVWRNDERQWMRWFIVGLLLGVILQGTLGGFRVLAESILLAKIHGCSAPVVFAMCALLVTWTSPRWRQAAGQNTPGQAVAAHGAAVQAAEQRTAKGPTKPATTSPRRWAAGIPWVSVLVATGIYALIVLGVQLRQQPPTADPFWFQLWLWTKLLLIPLVAVGVGWLPWVIAGQGGGVPGRRAVGWLIGVFSLQVLLGLGTWVVNYGFPMWFTDWVYPIEYTVVREGALQVWVTTAHMAVGALAFALALVTTAWTWLPAEVE